MRWLWNLTISSIGAKVLMALTGVVLVGFVFGHMIGNLQVFVGQETLNNYAVFLHSKPALLWVVRVGLLSCFVVHVIFSARLTLLNQAARPVAYQARKPLRSTFASRNMFVTGFVVLAFLLFHLAHFTWRITHPQYSELTDAAGRFDVYSMVILSFRDPIIAGSYIVAMILLGLHLSHAVSSIFQSLGLNTPLWFALTDKVGPVIAVIVVLGNLSMPIAILAGWVSLPPGVM